MYNQNFNSVMLFIMFYFRAWYVQAAAPAPKDVVICLDRSGSFTSRWDDAKSAVSTVFNTLNGNDRVSCFFNYITSEKRTQKILWSKSGILPLTNRVTQPVTKQGRSISAVMQLLYKLGGRMSYLGPCFWCDH